MTQIPIYRGRKRNGEWVTGFYTDAWYDDSEEADETDNAGTTKHCIIKNFETMHDDFEQCTFAVYEIDPETLAVSLDGGNAWYDDFTAIRTALETLVFPMKAQS